jgi:hypothetical protein
LLCFYVLHRLQRRAFSCAILLAGIDRLTVDEAVG